MLEECHLLVAYTSFDAFAAQLAQQWMPWSGVRWGLILHCFYSRLGFRHASMQTKQMATKQMAGHIMERSMCLSLFSMLIFRFTAA